MFDDGGQVCLAGTRLLVEASVRDAFVERFEVATKRHVLGDSRESETTISPLIHPDHLARVDGFVKRAKMNGDTVVFGAKNSSVTASGTNRRSSNPSRTIPRSSNERSSVPY